MPCIRFVPLFVIGVAVSGSIVSAALVQEAAVAPQQPEVAGNVYRIDLATGALTSLEFMKSKVERSGSSQLCYLAGEQSPVTLRRGEPLAFVGRVEGSLKNMNVLRTVSNRVYRLGLLHVNGTRRYATKEFVQMDGEPYGEVLSGVDPKHPKEFGQAFLFKPLQQLAPGEYAVGIGGVAPDTCGGPASAFRIIE